MRDLNVHEIEEVSGGWGGLSWFVLGLAVNVEDWGEASYGDMMLAP